MASLEVLLGVAAAVVLLGVLAVRVSVRLGLPSLLLYLGIGMLLGESVLGIQFSDAGLTEAPGSPRSCSSSPRAASPPGGPRCGRPSASGSRCRRWRSS